MTCFVTRFSTAAAGELAHEGADVGTSPCVHVCVCVCPRMFNVVQVCCTKSLQKWHDNSLSRWPGLVTDRQNLSQEELERWCVVRFLNST